MTVKTVLLVLKFVILLKTVNSKFIWGKSYFGCILECYDESGRSLNDHLLSNTFQSKFKQCANGQIYNLTLSNFLIPNGTLDENWITYNVSNNMKQIYIDRITIESSNIKEIADNAFTGKLFSKLIEISINVMSRTVHFHKGMLNGLNQLHKFELRKIGMSIIDVSILKPVKNTIHTISIYESNRINSQSMKNLFNIPQISLIQLSLHGNVINYLEKDTFINLTNLTFLRFKDIKNILTMDKDLLNPLVSLNWLDLKSLEINSLPIGCLDAHLHGKLFTIEFNGGWLCDCRAQYLVDANKQAIQSGNLNLFQREIICDSPKVHKGKKLLTDELKLCPDVEDEIESTTTKTTNEKFSSTTTKSIKTDFKEMSTKVTVPLVKEVKIDFNVSWVSGEKVMINVNTKTLLQEALSIIWFKGNSFSFIENNSSCLPISNATILINGLQKHNVYTFCLRLTSCSIRSFVPHHCMILENSQNIISGKMVFFLTENISFIIIIIMLSILLIIFGLVIKHYHNKLIRTRTQSIEYHAIAPPLYTK